MQSRFPKPQAPYTLKTEGFIYFVQAEAGGLVKIGWATNVEKRLATMQMVCPIPLTVLARFAGSVPAERALHQRFAAHRQHGEWFSPCPELMALIDETKTSRLCSARLTHRSRRSPSDTLKEAPMKQHDEIETIRVIETIYNDHGTLNGVVDALIEDAGIARAEAQAIVETWRAGGGPQKVHAGA